jgi:ABC-type dipeptide/oligopeptide/nickel transport system permease subunit
VTNEQSVIYEFEMERTVTEKYKKQETRDELLSEIGDYDGLKEKIIRMYRNNRLAAFSAALIILMILLAVFAPYIAPYKEAHQDLLMRLQPPSRAHLFGTDELGRDVFSRILYGARVSLVIGIFPSMISLLIGIFFGLIAGYFGGWIDYVIMRVADVMLSFPSLLLAMALMYTLGRYANSVLCIFGALSLVGWASVSRVVRSVTLSLKETEYVDAARSIGVGRPKIMLRHILPNCIPSLIVLYTLNVPSCILSESTLSFLGIGVQPPAASWGLMVNQSKQYLFTMPWLALAPCLTIMIVVLAFNFLGDGLRDALDPYLKKG